MAPHRPGGRGAARSLASSTRSLPKVHVAVADAIQELLQDRSGGNRPPTDAAKVLAFIYELWRLNMPFPVRGEVAKHLGVKVGTLDVILSQRLSERYISQDVKTREGNVQQRAGVVRDRYYVPADEVVQLADAAKARIPASVTTRR